MMKRHKVKGVHSNKQPSIRKKSENPLPPTSGHDHTGHNTLGQAHQQHRRSHIGKNSLEIRELNVNFKSFKTKSKSTLDSPNEPKKTSGNKVVTVKKGPVVGILSPPKKPSENNIHASKSSNSFIEVEVPVKRKIIFHHEDEVKIYVPHPREYRLSIQKYPHGPEIFTHSEQIWIEPSSGSSGDVTNAYGPYDVFGESLVKIVTVEPLFPDNEDDETSLATLDNNGQEPISFICHTAVGKEICVMTYTVTERPSGCSWYKKNLPSKLVLSVQDKVMVTIQQQDSSILVKDVDEAEVMELTHVPQHYYKCSKCQKKPFECSLFLKDDPNTLFGFVGRNPKSPKKIVHGQPLGFYFYMKNPASSPLNSLYKLYAFTILAGLNTIYKSLDV